MEANRDSDDHDTKAEVNAKSECSESSTGTSGGAHSGGGCEESHTTNKLPKPGVTRTWILTSII